MTTTVKTFPVYQNNVQIPLDDLKSILEPHFINISVKSNTVEILENNFDVDFRSVKPEDLTPELIQQAKISKEKPLTEFIDI
jgi:hypothetical protein